MFHSLDDLVRSLIQFRGDVQALTHRAQVLEKEIRVMVKSKNWIAGAIKKPGSLHAALGIPVGRKIPSKVLMVAAHKPGLTGKRARLAKTLRSFK